MIVKTHIKNLLVFITICAVITLLLATTNYITAPIIEKNQNASANKALLEVMPGGKGFEKMDIASFELPSTVTEAYKETSDQGYVIKLVTSGYGTDMVIMCGVSKEGVVTGAVCLSSNETLSKEKTYGENFRDKDQAGVEAVEIISGATKTTEAYKNAIKDALNTVIILDGGSVDIRSEEEILLDNLNNALPEGEKQFEKLFIVEQFDGIEKLKAIYVAKNQTGYVFVLGESETFIGVKADGTVLAEGGKSQHIIDAVEKIKSTTVSDIDITNYPDLQKTVVSAKKTQTGNFIFETKGAGYGIKGGNEYHPASNEYIIVRIAITPDGKILDCLTVSEEETDGLGDACKNEKFYGQFAGKTEENYKEIDAISGATMTTDGYKQAVQRAFDAVKVLKGGA